MNFEKAVVRIGFAGKQAFELQLGKLLFQLAKRVLGFLVSLLVTLFFREFCEFDIVGKCLLERMLTLDRLGQAITFFHQRLGFVGVVPEIRIFGALVQLFQTSVGFIPVKDASSAGPDPARSRRRD